MNSVIELFLKIKINPLFWFVVGIGVITGYFREVIMIFIIVFIHEMGHALMANYFHWRIHKIELLPFGGVADVEDASNRPFHEELLVIIMGPLQHVWMMLLSYYFLAFPFWQTADHQIFIWHNLMILSFNLIPVYPLDGGRLVQLFFSYRHSYVKALHYTQLLSGMILGLILILSAMFFPFHLNLWVVLTFLVITNYLEWKQRHYRFIRFLIARRSSVRERIRHSVVVVQETMRLRDVLKECRRGYYHKFKIVQTKKKSQILVKEEQLIDILFTEKKPQDPLSTFSFSNNKPF